MKYVYDFSEGSMAMKNILGGKGAGLCEMTKIKLPVPPGFVITADVCEQYYKLGKKYPESLDGEVAKYLNALEAKMGKKLGGEEDPLLVSVRSGAAVSMPGMMDTILNLGLNDKSVLGLTKKTSNKRFALDCYRRFIQMFSEIAMGLDRNHFEEIIEATKKKRNIKLDFEMNEEELAELIQKYKAVYKEKTSTEFPQDPKKQLWIAIGAVFGSWNNERAIVYRRLNNIQGLKGTAVTVQCMVFGNSGPNSATGVCFTRNPSTGENAFYVDI